MAYEELHRIDKKMRHFGQQKKAFENWATQPKGSLAERYRNIKKNIKEQNKRKENKTRSRKMSSEEVSENAKRYHLRPQDEQRLKEELNR